MKSIELHQNKTFAELAKEMGITEQELIKCARENGLIDENSNPTDYAIKEGLFIATPNFRFVIYASDGIHSFIGDIDGLLMQFWYYGKRIELNQKLLEQMYECTFSDEDIAVLIKIATPAIENIKKLCNQN